MRIAVVAGVFPCLSETFILDQITGLQDLGHEVRIIAVTDSANELQQSAIEERDLLRRTLYLEERSNSRTINALGCLKNLLKVAVKAPFRATRTARRCWPLTTKNRQFARLLTILDCDFDVVHCHFGPNGEDAVEARGLLGLNYPVVTSFHGADMKPEDGMARYSELFDLGDSFVANTAYTKKCLAQLGCPGRKIRVLPVGLKCNPKTDSPREERASEESLKLITVARLVPFKGLDIAIRATSNLRDAGQDVSYTIIGDGPLRDELQQLINQLDLPSVVTLAGPRTREEVFASFRSSDIFLLPSIEHEGRTETQGLVLQEAQAAGLPIVASRIGGIPEGLSKRNQQFLFTPANVDELVEQVVAAAQQRGDWPAIAAEGKQFVHENYDNSVLVQRLEAIYLECIARRPMRTP